MWYMQKHIMFENPFSDREFNQLTKQVLSNGSMETKKHKSYCNSKKAEVPISFSAY